MKNTADFKTYTHPAYKTTRTSGIFAPWFNCETNLLLCVF